MKFKYPIKIGWDNPKENIDDKVEHLLEYVKPSNITCYILIGYDTKEKDDLYRIYHIWDNYGILPYVMPYNKKSAYQRGIARWCNNRFVFKSVRWEVYKNTPYSATGYSNKENKKDDKV